jgi:DNA-binding MurR/RpiR family transcriptional regulator
VAERKRRDIESCIRTSFDTLSEGQRKVAEFALTHTAEAVCLPAARIAPLVSVSHSTVVRTAQALGFKGFPPFQAALQEWFMGQFNSVDRLQFGTRRFAKDKAGVGRAADSVFRQVMLADAAHIQNVAQQIPSQQFDRAVEMLNRADHVYILGLRASASLALNFGLAVRYIRPGCLILQQGFGDLPDQLLGISKGDLLVAMSYGRYARDTLRCMDYSQRTGAQVLAITDTPLSPAAKRADLALVLPVGLWFYVMSAAAHSFIGALVVALALRRKRGARQRAEQLEQAFQRFQIFERAEERDLLSQIEEQVPAL